MSPGCNMSMILTYKHWRMETDADQILWLFFDKQNESVNTIDREVMEEFNDIVDTLAGSTAYKGVIIASSKKNGFIAGADISQFTKFKDLDESYNVLAQGQQILNKLEALKMP